MLSCWVGEVLRRTLLAYAAPKHRASKERVVDRKYDPLVWLGNKIGIRNKDNDGRAEV